MKIGGMEKYSLLDYPDKISCIVYTIGCNFRCPMCYNKDLLSDKYFACSGRDVVPEELVLNYIKGHSHMLDAISITGGEPTMQPDLPEFCAKIKQLNKLVKVDTNGTNPTMLKNLLDKKLVNYIAMDLKGPFVFDYSKFSGVEADLVSENILNSIDIIKNSGIPHEFRITVGVSLTKQYIIDMINMVLGQKVFLQKFNPEHSLIQTKEFPLPREIIDEILEETKDIADVQLRGF